MRHGMRLMERIMDSTREMIDILCHGLIATRLCKLTNFIVYFGLVDL